jgi:dTDP-4-amino-4,6-dideoxygalactose transaminase
LSFKTVREFETNIAQFYDAPYAVAVDCCTHAVELCLRYTKPQHSIGIPTNTYISIPFVCEKLGLDWHWIDHEWEGYYHIQGTDIIDAAVHFERGSYIPLSFMCLSFQFKKPLSLGRGGAILCHYESDYEALKKMAYDGRIDDEPWGNQAIDTIGYHYYMTPETAQMGIDKLPVVAKQEWRKWSFKDYPYLPDMPVFTKNL